MIVVNAADHINFNKLLKVLTSNRVEFSVVPNEHDTDRTPQQINFEPIGVDEDILEGIVCDWFDLS
jgi:hypothetical protein